MQPLVRTAAGAALGAFVGAWAAGAGPVQATPPGKSAPAVVLYPAIHAAHEAAASGQAPRDADLVVGVVVGREARAYPLNLMWDESAHTVNDELGREPIAVALCPLAGVGAAFARRVGRETLEMGHVSEVERDTLVLYDTRSRSRWQLYSGEAFQGPLAGRRLERVPSLLTTWGRWRALHPDTTVYVSLSQAEKGFQLDDARVRRLLSVGGPLRRADWVLGLAAPTGEAAAVVLRSLAKTRVANETFAGRPVVVFLTSDLATAVAWERRVGSRPLTFTADGDRMVDAETGSAWDALTGKAVSGPLAGRKLRGVPSTVGFWHSWKSHHPQTQVVGLPPS